MDLAQRRWEQEQERLNELAAAGVASEEVCLFVALMLSVLIEPSLHCIMWPCMFA